MSPLIDLHPSRSQGPLHRKFFRAQQLLSAMPAYPCVLLSSTTGAMNAAREKSCSTCCANLDFLQTLCKCRQTRSGTGPDKKIHKSHCQTIGTVSGQVTVTLTGKPDSWYVPCENEDVSIEKCSLGNQTNNLAETVSRGTSCPADWQPTMRSRLQSAFTFRHLRAQIVWQPCCILQLRRARHRSFSWPHK
jgi:hypothetical protein